MDRPSTPTPQTPTREERRSDQEILGLEDIGDVVGAHRLEVRPGVPVHEGGGFGGQPGEGRGAGTIRACGGEHRGGPALAGLAHALPRLGRL